MALHRTPEEHDTNPPTSWRVRKIADRRWQLEQADGTPLDRFGTRQAAEEARTAGFLAKLYAKEGRWFAGESVDGWRPFAAVSS